jgi:hypothetical protein
MLSLVSQLAPLGGAGIHLMRALALSLGASLRPSAAGSQVMTAACAAEAMPCPEVEEQQRQPLVESQQLPNTNQGAHYRRAWPRSDTPPGGGCPGMGHATRDLREGRRSIKPTLACLPLAQVPLSRGHVGQDHGAGAPAPQAAGRGHRHRCGRGPARHGAGAEVRLVHLEERIWRLQCMQQPLSGGFLLEPASNLPTLPLCLPAHLLGLEVPPPQPPCIGTCRGLNVLSVGGSALDPSPVLLHADSNTDSQVDVIAAQLEPSVVRDNAADLVRRVSSYTVAFYGCRGSCGISGVHPGNTGRRCCQLLACFFFLPPNTWCRAAVLRWGPVIAFDRVPAGPKREHKKASSIWTETCPRSSPCHSEGASCLHAGCLQVTCLDSLHRVDAGKALREAHRILRPGGKLVVAFNDRCR